MITLIQKVGNYMVDIGSAIGGLFWALVISSLLISGSIFFLAKKVEFLAKQQNSSR